MRQEFKRFPNVGALLKSHFFAGLLVVIPLSVILWICLGVMRSIWGITDLLPADWQPNHLFSDPAAAHFYKVVFTLGCALLLALGVSIVGWISRQYIGRKVLHLIAEIIQHIPVIRSIYSALTQLLQTLASGGGQQFNRVVYVEYPRKQMWTLAFVTGQARGPGAPSGHLNIYVPTTPNPTSGFYLLVPESDVRESHMKVEDAFRTILSLGLAQPQQAEHPRQRDGA